MNKYLPALFLLLLGIGCAGSQRAADSLFRSPPALAVRLIASGPELPSPRELRSGDTVRGGEQVVLEVGALRPAHLYVVVFAETGKAELLYGGAAHKQVAPEDPARVVIPRRVLPGGAQAAETRVFVLATDAPLEPAMCPLLRVRCPLEQSASAAAEADANSCDHLVLSAAAAGVHSPATVIPLVLKY